MATEDLKARLEAAKAAAQAARDARELSEDEKLAAEVLRAENEAASEAAVTDAARKHGRRDVGFAVVPLTDDSARVVIVKRPDPVRIRAFMDQEKAATLDDAEALVLSCLVHPSAAAFADWTRDLPGVVTSAAIRACGLAGIRKTELAGK